VSGRRKEAIRQKEKKGHPGKTGTCSHVNCQNSKKKTIKSAPAGTPNRSVAETENVQLSDISKEESGKREETKCENLLKWLGESLLPRGPKKRGFKGERNRT